jgi:hypothetical protein
VLQGNPNLGRRFGVLPWVNALTVPDEKGDLVAGLCNPTTDPIRIKAGTRYGSFRRSCAWAQGENTPWRIAVVYDSEESDHTAISPTSAPASKGLTLKQRMAVILEQMRTGREIDVPKVTLPRSKDKKLEWIVREFNLDKSPCLKNRTEMVMAAELLYKYWDVINTDGQSGETNLLHHEIHTEDIPPIKCRTQPVNPALEPNLRRQINDWKKKDAIEESNSPWSFPLIAAPRRNGKIRWCVDYRRLNLITKKDTFPLPKIEDNLDQLSSSAIFSCIDGSGASQAIQIRPEDRPKTAFSTPWGLYQYKKVPFGLTNGPASYSRLIQLALSGVPRAVALPYLDDTIIHSTDMRQHFRNLEWILRIHRRAGLRLKPSQCQLFQDQVEYLGHLISRHGVKPIPSYQEAVRDWQLPVTGIDARIFLGKVGYYKRFIKDYSKIAGAWIKATDNITKEEEKKPLEITEDMKSSFEVLKQKLLEAPIMAYPQFDSVEPFILDTDWSHDANAIGAVLSQVQDGQERVICYGGKKLSASQKDYGATKGELTAFLHFAKHWRYYLQYKPFILRTDHQPLKYIHTMQPMDAHTARMLGVLSDLDFEVKHRAGTSHGNADALSRAPHVRESQEADIAVGADDELAVLALRAAIYDIEEDNDNVDERTSRLLRDYTPDQLRGMQEKDEVLSLVRRALKLNKKPHEFSLRSLSSEARTYFGLWPHLRLNRNGLLYFHKPTSGGSTPTRPLLCLPQAIVEEVVKLAHSDGDHVSVEETTQRVLLAAYTPGLRIETEDIVRRCHHCQVSLNGHDTDQTTQIGRAHV